MTATRDRFASSWLGAQWLHPELQGFRQWAEQQLHQAPGFTTHTQLPHLWNKGQGMELSVAISEDEPALLMQVRHPDADLMVTELSEAEDLAFDANKQHGVGLVDGHLVYGRGVQALASLPPSTIDADLVINWSRQAILTTLAEIAPREPELQQALPFIESLLPAGYATASFSPSGLEQRTILNHKPAGLQPIDRSVFDRMPADSVVAGVIGVDGAAWYRAHREALLPLIAEATRQSDGEAGEAFAHNMLAGFGIQGGIEGLLGAFTGNIAISVSGDGLMPHIVLALPRKPSIISFKSAYR